VADRTLKLSDARGGETHDVEIRGDGSVHVGGRAYRVEDHGSGSLRVSGNQRTTTAWVALTNGVRWVFIDGRAYALTEPSSSKRRGGGLDGSLMAPMPATVRRVLVSTGDQVKAGDTLIILEAMKMELPVRTAVAGTVQAIHCREGELVQPAVTLIEVV